MYGYLSHRYTISMAHTTKDTFLGDIFQECEKVDQDHEKGTLYILILIYYISLL